MTISPEKQSRPGPASRRPFPDLVGHSEAFRALIRGTEALLESSPGLVLLRGETGAGKTLLARAIHRRARAGCGPFLFLPCGAFPNRVIECELFGVRDGSAPGRGLLALAGSGTLLVEDADRLSPSVLARLVHRLRGHGPLPLVIATTRRSRHEPSEASATHEGSGAWLDADALDVPPLRRRMDDLELLATHFLTEWGGAREASPPELSTEAVEALHSHPWPGNVRELRHVIEGAASVAPGCLIRAEHLRVRVRDTRPLPDDRDIAPEMIRIPSKGKSWELIEVEAVQAMLRITGWNRSQAARILGVSRPTLARKIRKFGLEPPAHHR